MTLPDLPSGVYRHYKGPLYFVFGYGHDANAEDLYTRHWAANGAAQFDLLNERAVVVYMGLELTDAHTGPRWAVRTAADFFARVHQDGSVCEHTRATYRVVAEGRDSECCDYRGEPITPRFTYTGPTWEGPA